MSEGPPFADFFPKKRPFVTIELWYDRRFLTDAISDFLRAGQEVVLPPGNTHYNTALFAAENEIFLHVLVTRYSRQNVKMGLIHSYTAAKVEKGVALKLYTSTGWKEGAILEELLNDLGWSLYSVANDSLETSATVKEGKQPERNPPSSSDAPLATIREGKEPEQNPPGPSDAPA